MRLINRLNSDSRQEAFLTGNAGQRIKMKLRYLPTQKIWMMDISTDDFEVNGIAVLYSYNLLKDYDNIIDFGISCLTLDGQDPRNVTDFESGYAFLYLLNGTDVQEISAEVYE